MSKKLPIISLIFLLLSFPLQDVVKSVWDSWVNYNPPEPGNLRFVRLY